jgi:hypothetical protein
LADLSRVHKVDAVRRLHARPEGLVMRDRSMPKPCLVTSIPSAASIAYRRRQWPMVLESHLLSVLGICFPRTFKTPCRACTSCGWTSLSPLSLSLSSAEDCVGQISPS